MEPEWEVPCLAVILHAPIRHQIALRSIPAFQLYQHKKYHPFFGYGFNLQQTCGFPYVLLCKLFRLFALFSVYSL